VERFKETYLVVSTRLFSGKTIVRIYSESDPGEDFKSVEPILEDVYFHTLSTKQNKI